MPQIRRRLLIAALKYIPALGTFIYTLHIAFLLLGYQWNLAEMLVGLSLNATVLLWLLSDEFHFCRLHKCLIGYNASVDICIILRRMGFLGVVLTPMRVVMMMIGFALLICLVCKGYKNDYDEWC